MKTFTAVALAVLVPSIAPAGGQGNLPGGIDDYFRLIRFEELALSPSGDVVAYRVSRRDPDTNSTVSQVFIHETAEFAASPEPLNTADATDLAWLPDGRLAFLERTSGDSRIATYDQTARRIARLTKPSRPVIGFKFSPRGAEYGFIAIRTARIEKDGRQEGLKLQGLRFDPETTLYRDLLRPSLPREASPQALILVTGGKEYPLDIPGSVVDFHWSPDSRHLSVTYEEQKLKGAAAGVPVTSVALVAVWDRNVRVLAAGEGSRSGAPSVHYFGGEWEGSSSRVMIRRYSPVSHDPWVDYYFPQCALINVLDDSGLKGADWTELEDYSAVYVLSDNLRWLVENTRKGRRQLFALDTQLRESSVLLHPGSGSVSRAAISKDGSKYAFVYESLTDPPEVFFRDAKGALRQLTHMNAGVFANAGYTARQIAWDSRDGYSVSGWLLMPGDGIRAARSTITFVHGGPAYVYANTFAPYMDGVWSFPLEILAVRGFVVFIPNYRGTPSFGRTHQDPGSQDVEPVDDIVTGIEHLIARGIADPERLGITGHSHGVWLGATVQTRLRKFVASSFADSSSNRVVTYALNSNFGNRVVNDRSLGVSLYEAPQRYVDASPDLRYAGLKSANLFEAGAESAAIPMLAMVKPSHRFSMPTEFIVYPNTEHNLQEPRLMRESARRNLDWFRFWLQGYEDPREDARDQYKRWRSLRANWKAIKHQRTDSIASKGSG